MPDKDVVESELSCLKVTSMRYKEDWPEKGCTSVIVHEAPP